jgi:hypothetical protein
VHLHTRSLEDHALINYIIAVAEQLTSQLTRLVTLNTHQLAGQVANLSFWSDEVAHALAVLDGYSARFGQLSAAQREYVTRHGTTEFRLDDEWGDTYQSPLPPRPLSDRERQAARTALTEAFYRLLIRCHSAKLINGERVRTECGRHGMGVDPADLRR